MTLTDYARKRDFARTPEPAGARLPPPPEEPRRFVIQKHKATRLHYDFRLEMQGVLKSWAVPKGIPFKHGDKHLAVQVEDHPVEYAAFEGTIARGNYGAGTVMIWDQGTYESPDGNPVKGLYAGKLRLHLHGSKLEGEWTLVRSHHGNEDKPGWLLIKTEADAVPVTEEEDDESAVSHRSMAGIGSALDPQWDPAYRPAAREARTKEIAQVSASLPRNEPVFQAPMHPRLADRLPTGDGWLYELKFDGYRAVGLKNGDKRNLLSRNELDLGGRFPEALEALKALPCRTAVVDGEIVAVEENGGFSFQLLQNAGNDRPVLLYYLFDLLHLDGKDMTGMPLVARKRKLQELMAGIDNPVLKFSADIQAEPHRLIAEVERLGLEGIVAKKADSLYESGRRTGAWVKWKTLNRQEFIIGGFTQPGGSRQHLGALIVGYREGGKLNFASKVGTGFSDEMLTRLHAMLLPLERADCPFANLPMAKAGPFGQGLTAAEMRTCTWVEPTLVCEVCFSEWTRDGQLRHPSFKGLRPDKKASEVVRERPEPPPGEGRAGAEPEAPAEGEAPLAVALSNPDKVLFPESGITKGELVEYYRRIAPRMLPYLKGRPIAMERFPDGIDREGFYHKDAPPHFPQWIPRVKILKDDGTPVFHAVVENVNALVYLANQACITPHAWLSRRDKLDYPDLLVIDLDPSGDDYSHVCEAALLLQQLFEKLGLAPYVKTTGSRGLHVVVPLDRRADFPTVRDFALDVARVAAMLDPARLTTEHRKHNRKGRLFLDYTRNAYGQTIAPPYAVRPREGAPVSTPLDWSELADCTGISARYRIRNIFKRLETGNDPWKGMTRKARSLRKPRKLLDQWLHALRTDPGRREV